DDPHGPATRRTALGQSWSQAGLENVVLTAHVLGVTIVTTSVVTNLGVGHADGGYAGGGPVDVVEGLQQLGFTAYEAKVYLALLSRPGSTGYEVARHSGVPRSKVYEVLEKLTAMDVVHTS